DGDQWCPSSRLAEPPRHLLAPAAVSLPQHFRLSHRKTWYWAASRVTLRAQSSQRGSMGVC
ncbi:MAG: hypothetical protein R3274_03935, partial [Desulfobacterales bacterium]|nr:hypothetical protein [Desulfobacterales bacterium]